MKYSSMSKGSMAVRSPVGAANSIFLLWGWRGCHRVCGKGVRYVRVTGTARVVKGL